jgi:hypothetical protein
MIELLAIAGAVITLALGLLATPIGLPVLSWLVGNPIGRVVAIVGISIALLAVVIRLSRQDGAAAAKSEVTRLNLEALRDRIAVDEEVRSMPADKRREELRKWVR